eukprot:4899947-Prymnesium_polylepis.1
MDGRVIGGDRGNDTPKACRRGVGVCGLVTAYGDGCEASTIPMVHTCRDQTSANLGEVAVEVGGGVLEVGRNHAHRYEGRWEGGVERVDEEGHDVARGDARVQKRLHVMPRAEAQVGVKVDTADKGVGLGVPRDLSHHLGGVEGDATRPHTRVVAGRVKEAKRLLAPLALVAADGHEGPALVERDADCAGHVLAMRRPAVEGAEAAVAARRRLVVHVVSKRARARREVQLRAAALHAVRAQAHAHEGEVVELVDGLIERLLEAAALVQSLMQRRRRAKPPLARVEVIELGLGDRVAMLEAVVRTLLHVELARHVGDLHLQRTHLAAQQLGCEPL